MAVQLKRTVGRPRLRGTAKYIRLRESVFNLWRDKKEILGYGNSTDSMFAFILSGKSDGRCINSFKSAFEETALNLKANLLTYSVLVGISAGKISMHGLAVWQSNVHPRRLNVGTVYAGIIIAISTVKLDIYAPDE